MKFFLGIFIKFGIMMDLEENKDVWMCKVFCCGFGKEFVRF